LAFSPAPGSDRRTIIAQFELAGLPAETVRLASFNPPSQHLGKPARLKATRRGLTLGVSWRAVPGATSYQVVARLSTGGERVVRTRRLSASFRRVPRFDGGPVSVRAVASMRNGKPSVVRVRPIGHAPTRFGPRPRPPRH